MPKKKNYKQGQKPIDNQVLRSEAFHSLNQSVNALAPVIPPKIQSISLPEAGNESHLRNLDFTPYYGQNYDEVVFYTQQALTLMVQESINTNGQSLSITTIGHYFYAGLKYFFPFCAIWSQALGRDIANTRKIQTNLL